MHDRNPSTIPQRPAHVGFRAGYVLALTLVTILVCVLVPEPKAGGESGVMTKDGQPQLPEDIGELFGHDQKISEAELYILPKDTSFARKSYGPPGTVDQQRILCSIILSGAEQRSIHRPEVCLVAQGWSIIGREDIPVHLNSGRTLVLRNFALQRNAVTQDNGHKIIRAYFMYWFVGENVTTPSEFTRIFVNSWDRVMHNRAHRWAYVSLLSPISNTIRPDGLNEAQTRTMMIDFIREAVPSFQKSEMVSQATN